MSWGQGRGRGYELQTSSTPTPPVFMHPAHKPHPTPTAPPPPPALAPPPPPSPQRHYPLLNPKAHAAHSGATAHTCARTLGVVRSSSRMHPSARKSSTASLAILVMTSWRVATALITSNSLKAEGRSRWAAWGVGCCRVGVGLGVAGWGCGLRAGGGWWVQAVGGRQGVQLHKQEFFHQRGSASRNDGPIDSRLKARSSSSAAVNRVLTRPASSASVDGRIEPLRWAWSSDLGSARQNASMAASGAGGAAAAGAVPFCAAAGGSTAAAAPPLANACMDPRSQGH